jgi:hypothetical protein
MQLRYIYLPIEDEAYLGEEVLKITLRISHHVSITQMIKQVTVATTILHLNGHNILKL